MHRLQRIRDGRVSNSCGFGKAFARLCRSDGMLDLMPDHGFGDGGCLSLALAVQAWLGEDSVRIRFAGRPGQLDHAVAEISIEGRPFYLDGDGLGTWDDVVEKLRRLEFCAGALLVDATVEDAAAHGIVDDGRHADLAAVIASALGGSVPSREWLDEGRFDREPVRGPAP